MMYGLAFTIRYYYQRKKKWWLIKWM
jgi:hypothetical protein